MHTYYAQIRAYACISSRVNYYANLIAMLGWVVGWAVAMWLLKHGFLARPFVFVWWLLGGPTKSPLSSLSDINILASMCLRSLL